MFLVSKHLDLVMGLDIHMVTIPPSPAPVPMPHVYIGFVMDPMDYIPFVGSMIHINNSKRSNCETTSMLGTKMHIPMGAGFHPASIPMIAHEGVEFFGSNIVKADGSFLSGSTFMMMTCSCIGMPIGGDKHLPTSSTIPIPKGQPVFVGGPQVPDVMGMIMAKLMDLGMGFLLKKAGKLFKKVKCKKKFKGCAC